jgi:hypothetical protein
MAVEETAAAEPQATEEGAVRAGEVPRATEEIHLPEPSYLPVVLAFGITVALVGIVLTFVMCIIGGIIALVALYKWIRAAREEMSELPLDQ